MLTERVEPMMRLECAWCGATIREGDVAAETSHGICRPCLAVELAKAGLVPEGGADDEV